MFFFFHTRAIKTGFRWHSLRHGMLCYSHVGASCQREARQPQEHYLESSRLNMRRSDRGRREIMHQTRIREHIKGKHLFHDLGGEGFQALVEQMHQLVLQSFHDPPLWAPPPGADNRMSVPVSTAEEPRSWRTGSSRGHEVILFNLYIYLKEVVGICGI